MSSLGGSATGGSYSNSGNYSRGNLGRNGSAAQVVSWVAPCISSGLTRTVVHFFPAARGVASPYAVSCRLTLFGGGIERRSVVLEGARLNQPDGLFVDEAFPELPEMVQAAASVAMSAHGSSATGFNAARSIEPHRSSEVSSFNFTQSAADAPRQGYAGIELELFTDQPRVDMSPSRCVFEYHSGVNVVRFNPIMLLGSTTPAMHEGAVFKDAHVEASLVVVNRSKMQVQSVFEIRPTLQSALQSGAQVAAQAAVDSVEGADFVSAEVSPTELSELVSGQSIVEIPLPPGFGPASIGSANPWGAGWSGVVRLRERLPAGCGVMVLFRDTQTRQPVSAVAI